MKLNSIFVAAVALTLSACGDTEHSFGGSPKARVLDPLPALAETPAPECYGDGLHLAANCETVNNPESVIPVDGVSTLLISNFSGPVSPIVVVPYIRKQGGAGGGTTPWATSPTSILTTISSAGQCISLNIKASVSGVTPPFYNRTSYLSASSSKFEVCEEGLDISVKFNADNDSQFDDYEMRISDSGGRKLLYSLQGNSLIVCLD